MSLKNVFHIFSANLIVKDLVLSVFELVLNCYKKISLRDTNNQNIKLTQNQSMQMLFDLKFLFVLFDLKVNLLNKKHIQEEYNSVCAQLESLIDPFDYDICTPFIQSNINKSIVRTSTLYGVLNINERLSRSTTNSATSITTANEKYNLLVLSNSQHRFELLPLPSQQTQLQINSDKQTNIQFKNQVNNLVSSFLVINKKCNFFLFDKI
jgi:hypothetical protein